jgi:hypothetical protein
MGFFKELTVELNRSPAMRLRPAVRGDFSEVLKYAPAKLRSRRNAEDRLGRLETENRYWRERACRAEVRVQFLETSIQRIALFQAAPFVKTD